MAIDYRQSGIDYRSTVYSYQGIQVHAITAAITGTGTVTAAITSGIFIYAAITGTATVTAAIVEGASLTAAVTGTATVTAAIFEEAFVAGDITSTATATAAIVRERPITAAITGTGAVTAALIEEAFIEAGVAASATVTAVIDSIMISGGFTGTATLSQPIITHRVPQPELTLTISNITASSKNEEQQDTLSLLVGV